MSIVDERTNPAKFQNLIAIAQAEMEKLRIPGVAMGLLVEGEEFTAGLGITSIENPLPVTPDTLFRLGSITKTHTATAIFRLMEQGKLGLDDPVRRFIPDFKVQDPAASSGVTIRHLLNHTSGWVGDYFVNTGDGDDALARYIEKMAEIPQQTRLGGIFTYNNAAFNLLGRVIEIVTGQTYEDAIRELVLAPLEMKASFFNAGEVMMQRFVMGHTIKDGQLIVTRPWVENRCDAACGGLVSGVLDPLRYARFHMGDGTSPNGTHLLSSALLKGMQIPGLRAGGEGWIGLNWFIKDVGEVRIIGHGGSSNGQQADFWFAPQRQVAFTVLTNLDQGNRLIDLLNKWVQEHYLGAVETVPVPVNLPDIQLAEFSGIYTMSITGDLFEFQPKGGGLIMTHTRGDYSAITDTPPEPIPPTQCAFLSFDEFLFLEGPLEGMRGEFLRAPDGSIAWLRFGGRVFHRLSGAC